MYMKRTLLALFAGTLIFLAAGCGGGGGGGGGNDSGTAGTKLGLFSEQVKACTPYLNKGSLSTGGSNLTDWNSWNPGASNTVLGKLFDPANGKDECIYSKLQVLDSHIQLVNQFSDSWLTSGVYSQGNIKATVDTSVSTVSITYRGLVELPSEVDRIVTLSVPSQDLIIHMAFSQNGGNQAIMEQYTIGGSEAGAYIATIEGDNIQFWNADITSSKVQIMWEGNTSDKSFKISECTDASEGNWEVMGGGASTGEMAFIARNKVNNDSQDEYYITISADDLADGLEQPIINAKTLPPDGTGILRYITTDSLSFLSDYPDTPDDLTWNQ